MASLNSLRWQHDQATQLTLRLINAIEAHRHGDDCYPIALQLARWVGLLRLHLANEDEWLYPAMIASRDVTCSATATAFQRKMGNLAERLEAFDRRWSFSALIGGDFPRFRTEAFALFADFDRRIAREDQTLYPLAEVHGIGVASRAA